MFSYEKIKSLNELEISIYNFVVAHPEEAADMTIRELANELHVSSTTILRFCSKMGCEGYSEFKYQLKSYIKESKYPEQTDDFAVIMDFFERIENGSIQKEIRKAADIIAQKEKVFFTGLGTSGTLAKYGARYLSNLGKNAFYLDDPFYPTDNGNYKDTVIVALSVSGEQRFLHRQIDGFKKGRAVVISITNTKQCTLAEISDFNLNYYMPMKILPGQYNVTSQVPVIYILELLAQEVQRKIKCNKHIQ